MTKEELQEYLDAFSADDNIIILEPQEEFNSGIVGITIDGCHLIYDYKKLVIGLAEKYHDEDSEEGFDECILSASEWVEFNTIRSLPYMNSEYRPIIINDFNGD